MILHVTYKDGDHFVEEQDTPAHHLALTDLSLRDRLYEIGIRKYITLQVDTETGVVTFQRPKK